jgi:hypothetical protein
MKKQLLLIVALLSGCALNAIKTTEETYFGKQNYKIDDVKSMVNKAGLSPVVKNNLRQALVARFNNTKGQVVRNPQAKNIYETVVKEYDYLSEKQNQDLADNFAVSALGVIELYPRKIVIKKRISRIPKNIVTND